MSYVLYREITPYSDSADWWNNVTINAGAAQSTLQDIKIPEGAGSFSYHNSGDLSSGCSNRFLFWRTNHDVIEFVEISLDVQLRSNQLRLRFQNTPILPGVSVQENLDEVVILIATVSAIHKLSFPHPRRLERDASSVKKRDASAPSIFYDTTEESLRTRSRYFVLNNVSVGNPLPHTSCSWLDKDSNAVFLLANNAGSLLMLVLTDKYGVEVTRELNKSGSLFSIFNGLVPSMLKSNRVPAALSVICHRLPTDVLVYSLFNDLQIRIWSLKRQDYVFIDSIQNFDAQKYLSAGNFTANLCQLRKSGSSPVYLGVFVPVLSQKLFYVFKQVEAQDRLKLELITVLHQTEHDLVDFCIGVKRVWTLWLSSENQPIILSALIDPSAREHPNLCWVPVDLEPRVSRQIDLTDLNPQEAYMKEIFKAGRFLPATISKAVSIYNSMRSTNFSFNTSVKTDDLKSRVLEAVENEIHLRTRDFDPTENEQNEVVVDCWDRFFSYCIQYHEVGMKPLGMVCDDNTGTIISIKKSYYSLLCPCDPLQYIVSPDFRRTSFSPSLLEDHKLYVGVKAVLSCIDVIRSNVDEKLLSRFEDKVFNLYSPIKYASEIAKTLDLNSDSNILIPMQSLLPCNTDLIATLNHLISKLDLGEIAKDPADYDFIKYPAFANSSSGVGALCSGLSHFARERFEFCRDLLLFEVIIWGIDSMESDQLDSLRMQSRIIPNTVSLVRSYFIVHWCTECNCIPVSAATQDAAFKQFCVLELPEFMNRDLTIIRRESTINHLFFQEDGGVWGRKLISLKCGEGADNWVSLFPLLVLECATLLWPMDEDTQFPEFLFSHCQFAPLQEYNRLLQDWCSWNNQYLDFLVATSHLIMNEPKRALKLFLHVSKNIDGESLLSQRVLTGRHTSDASLTSLFGMKVVRMFEQLSLSDCVVKLVSTVIDDIEKSDPHVPIFHSVLFKHHLSLGDAEEAFTTLIKNPDSSRREDCLRQLIVYLCEKKQFQKIIELSPLEYEDKVIGILESRARCSDLSKNTSFYGILYALHIHHKKFRKAASVMYELAMRFGKELFTLKGLARQVSCYLTAIDCLYLSEPNYAWIVKPVVSSDDTSGDEMDTRNSPKRDNDGEEISSAARSVKVEVLGIEEIRREYILAQAQLQHARKYQTTSNLAITPLNPEETVALLLNASLYDAAINLSKSFSLSLSPVFEALVLKCLSSTFCSETYTTSETDGEVLNKSVMPDDYASSSSKSQWSMLQKLLFEHEPDEKSELHKCVTEKLLSHGADLPAWLRLSYQKRNFTELIYLYISHGQLENAMTLMIKYIKAVMGVRKEDFNLEFTLHCSSPAVWLPHSYIDILLNAAEDLQDEEPFKTLYYELEHTLKDYNQTVESVTASRVALRSP